MAEGDEGRVEAHLVLIGRGMGVTPEKIAELQQQAARMERLHRPRPSQEFGQVLAKKASDAPQPEPTKKQLVHPAQRGAFGREETKADEAVIIKG